MTENAIAFMDDESWRIKYIPFSSNGNYRLKTLSKLQIDKLEVTVNANCRIFIAYDKQ